MVRVVIQELRNSGGTKLDKGNYRYVVDENYIEKSVTYKGLDEFREIIRREEQVKIDQDMNLLNENIQEHRNINLQLGKNIELYKSQKAELKNEIDKLVAEAQELRGTIDIQKRNIEANEEHIKNLIDDRNKALEQASINLAETNKWRSKKSFWYWIFS